MNKAILFILLLIPNTGSFAQEKDFDKEIMIGVYAIGGWNIPVRLTTKFITEETSPWYGYESYSAGIKVSMMVFEKSGIEIATCYSKHKIGFELSPPIYTERKIYMETFRIISIPITYKRYFQNNFFFNAGTIIDFKLKDEPIWVDAQSGFGLTFRAGKEIRIHNLILDIAPDIELHSLVPFITEDFQQRLFVGAIRIGISYNLKSAKTKKNEVDEQ